MAVATTGSTVQGLVQGLSSNLVGNVATDIDGIGEPIIVTGDPDKIVTHIGSQIAYDVTNEELYMGLGANGSKWIHLISGA